MSLALSPQEKVRYPAPGRWVFDPAHTRIEAIARHMMIAKVRGIFTDFAGHFDVAEDPLGTKISVTINAASIDTGNEARDAHLRSSDFLDVESHPTIRFESTKIERAGDAYRITGDLTIRRVTRPVTIDGQYLGLARDEEGTEKAFFTGKTVIEREDFGMTWNQVLESGGVLVGSRLQIELEVEAQLA